MKVGDLVRYCNSAYPSKLIGIILEIDHVDAAISPYRVRWTDHNESIRDWYGIHELIKP